MGVERTNEIIILNIDALGILRAIHVEYISSRGNFDRQRHVVDRLFIAREGGSVSGSEGE